MMTELILHTLTLWFSAEKITAAEVHFAANKVSAKVNAVAATVSVYWHVIQSGTSKQFKSFSDKLNDSQFCRFDSGQHS
jgi:tryptophan 2,3-dioxygenase